MSRLIIFLAVGAALYLRPLLDVPPPVPAQPHAAPIAAVQPANDREAWAVDLLARLGNQSPTAETVAVVVEWTIAEDGGPGAFERNNPLNTTMCGYNNTGAINGDGACGVSGYATRDDGLNATVATLMQANFTAVRNALQTNDAEAVAPAIWASPWATSHYGYGANWPHVGG